jgi:hypothetical protein
MAYGDIRVARRAEWLIEQVARTGSLVVRDLGETRAGEAAIHGFLSSPYVSVDAIVADQSARTVAQCAGRDVLVVQDTSEVNFKGRDRKRRGFGPAGDGETPGFFIHPAIAVDVESEALIGLLDAEIWTRAPGRVAARRKRELEDKESARWLRACDAAAEKLKAASSVTMVADRESDIFLLFARRQPRLELIVRAGQDRALSDGGRLFQALDASPALGVGAVAVAPRGPGDKGRIAMVELRARRVRLARPKSLKAGDAPAEAELWLVEARETGAPAGVTPLHWRLLTTSAAASAADASRVVGLYRLRWRIEQVFRALKSDGMALEDSQIVEASRMLNLAALGLAGAIRTIQLVDARDGGMRPMTDVLDESALPALKKLTKKLEGATERQKNPHPPGALSYVSWIAARLGGWNCYYKPPGPKTMRKGWNRLVAMLEGYELATHGENL